jgi:hypothetical protein
MDECSGRTRSAARALGRSASDTWNDDRQPQRELHSAPQRHACCAATMRKGLYLVCSASMVGAHVCKRQPADITVTLVGAGIR